MVSWDSEGHSSVTQAPLSTLIPEGYALARLMAEDRRAAVEAIQLACDRKIDEIELQLDTMEKAYGVHKQPDPMRRLAAYLLKPDMVWQEQKARFPHDYEEDWDDFQELRIRAERGEFS